MDFLAGAGRIACTAVGVFEAFSYPWPPSPTFYKLREMERTGEGLETACAGGYTRAAAMRRCHSGQYFQLGGHAAC